MVRPSESIRLQVSAVVSSLKCCEIGRTHLPISDENAMMSPSTEPVPDFPEEVNPRARASLSSGVASFVWMATTGGSVIHYVLAVKYSPHGLRTTYRRDTVGDIVGRSHPFTQVMG